MNVKYVFLTTALLILYLFGYSIIKPAPLTIQYGAGYYSDPLNGVVGYDLGKVLGASNGFSLRGDYKNYFNKNRFYFRSGIGLDIPLSKKVKVKDKEITYTHSAIRLGLPNTFGVIKNGIYLGAGVTPTYYKFSYEDNYETTVTYTASNLFCFHTNFGIEIDFKKNMKFYAEINSMNTTMKAKKIVRSSFLLGDEESEANITLNYTRLFFGLIQDF